MRDVPAAAKYPPGCIILPSGDLQRYTDYFTSIVSLRRPPKTVILPVKGTSVARNKNGAIRHAFEKDIFGEWVWTMGDDHTFPPDIIYKLLDYDVDIVAPLVVKRKPPFPPVIYKSESVTKAGFYRRFKVAELPSSGLVEVVACSTAGMLVRRKVYETMRDPWFELGKTSSDAQGEDLHWCQKARDAGFTIHMSMDIAIGHITPVIIKPHIVDGKWVLGVDFDQGYIASLPFPETLPNAVCLDDDEKPAGEAQP